MRLLELAIRELINEMDETGSTQATGSDEPREIIDRAINGEEVDKHDLNYAIREVMEDLKFLMKNRYDKANAFFIDEDFQYFAFSNAMKLLYLLARENQLRHDTGRFLMKAVLASRLSSPLSGTPAKRLIAEAIAIVRKYRGTEVTDFTISKEDKHRLYELANEISDELKQSYIRLGKRTRVNFADKRAIDRATSVWVILEGLAEFAKD